MRLSRNGEYYVVLVAPNGQVLMTSETYTRKADAERGRKAVRRAMLNPKFEDRTR